MGFIAKLSRRIGDDLVRSNVVKAEDAEIYIYGINQILISVLNVFSALIIGLIFGVFFEILVFMAVYIPLRSYAGGYHARTPLRCYIFSVIMLIAVSLGLKYLCIAEWVYYVVFALVIIIICVLSPVEDKNKPLDEIEYKVYKKRTIVITITETFIGFMLAIIGINNLFIAVVYSFVALSTMLIVGKIKLWTYSITDGFKNNNCDDLKDAGNTVSPKNLLIIDLRKKGKEITSLYDGVDFDIDKNGFAENTHL